MTDNTTHDSRPAAEYLLTSGEVAVAFRVHPKTIGRWVLDGKMVSIRTPGGHHRFRQADVRALLNGDHYGQCADITVRPEVSA